MRVLGNTVNIQLGNGNYTSGNAVANTFHSGGWRSAETLGTTSS